MARSANAQLAVDQYKVLAEERHWDASTAWHGIAKLLLSCDKWENGWKPFHNAVVYREVNDFPRAGSAPNLVLNRAQKLTSYLAEQLESVPDKLCGELGLYWKDPVLSDKQPHNLVGHAFRSIVVTALQLYGDPGVTYEEEVPATREFPGFEFRTRSERAKIDIVARREPKTVALISTRWRFRHDRVDVHEEALAYVGAARRLNPTVELYAFVGEFAPDRLKKVLDSCKPEPNAPLDAAVHFEPRLITEGLGVDGRMIHLRSLEWLIRQTHKWR